jgi:hypothetical protein
MQSLHILQSWKDPQAHAMAAVCSPWYKMMFAMQSTLYHEALGFFHRDMVYKVAARAALVHQWG